MRRDKVLAVVSTSTDKHDLTIGWIGAERTPVLAHMKFTMKG